MRRLNTDEENWLRRLTPAAQQRWETLNKFERQFVIQLDTNLRQYGQNTSVSPKQWQVITEISEKVF